MSLDQVKNTLTVVLMDPNSLDLIKINPNKFDALWTMYSGMLSKA